MNKEKEVMKNEMEEIKEDIDIFYQQRTGEGLKKFDCVLDKVSNIVNCLFGYKEKHEEFSLNEERMKESLTEAMNALEERDFILLADILQYDFIEYVEELIEEMA